MTIDPRIFPTALIVLSAGASAVWFWHGDWRRGVYWLAAVCINYVITY